MELPWQGRLLKGLGSAGVSRGACPPKVCTVGERGNILPLFGDAEQEWPTGLRVVLYSVGLAWTFMGVAIVSDVFMGAIQRVTSKKKRIIDAKTKRGVTVKVWNDTVANLTLMALGSSAPEILLSVIELVSGKMYSGELGPSTIVGSAAFNLFCISAVCVMAIPEGEVRFIKDTHVFYITASFSVLAYLWLYIIVGVSSENRIELWEGLVTFIMFPVLIVLAYHADIGTFSSQSLRDSILHSRISLAEISKEELAEMEAKVLRIHFNSVASCGGSGEISDQVLARMIAQEHGAPRNRAQYRVAATRGMFGGKRVESKMASRQVSCDKVLPFDSSGNKIPLKEDDITIEFCAATYEVVESVGKTTVMVKRSGYLETSCFVDYHTKDGTAHAGEDYIAVKGTLEFLKDEAEKPIDLEIIDDNAYEDDEEFFVILSNARCKDSNYQVGIGRICQTKVSIVDDDEPGILLFQEDHMKVTEGIENKVIPVTVRRTGGSAGNITCKYYTEDGSATADRDYKPESGILRFANNQTSATIEITIFPRGRYDISEEFRVILTDPTDGARFDPNTDGGADSCIQTITVLADETEVGRVDRIMACLQLDWDKAQIGHHNWKDQIRDAFFVNGESDEPASVIDWAMHIVTFVWKVIFATIPPVDYCDGWACFVCSLIMIGGVTALIGDLADLLGCVLTCPNSITAITFVALGTSLPDTFASKTAAEQDPHADASIGNITGSNSVNVFLGLGMPWTLGAIYWNYIEDYDSPEGRDWVLKYPDIAKEFPGELKFVVMGGDLGFSVVVFSICATICIAVLQYRRSAYGGELGGPMRARFVTCVFFVSLWFLYVGLSSWKALDSDKCS